MLAQLPILGMAQTNPWVQYEISVGQSASFDNHLEIFQNGSSQKGIQKVIEDSQKFLLIQLLSVECDSATEPFIQLLEKKAAQGVRIYLLINKLYSLLSGSCLQRLEKADIHIKKVKTHSSYWVNDQNYLLIGSESLARMFLLSDGRNNLDRDIMVGAQGPLSTDAILDFTHVWNEGLQDIKDEALTRRQQEIKIFKREFSSQNSEKSPCFFLSENADLGLKSWSDTLIYWASQTKNTLFLSGVKIDSSHEALQKKLIEAAVRGVSIQYLGNGPGGGNGEFTMVLNEWIEKKSIFTGLLTKLRDWDSKRQLESHYSSYNQWLDHENMQVFLYDQFLHYKVWNFDNEALLVGSANMANESFKKFHEAAIFCRDKNFLAEWKKAQNIDLQNSEPFQKK